MHFTQNKNQEKLVFALSLARITFLSCKEKNILSKKLDSSYSLALLSIEEIFKMLNRPVPARAVWNGMQNLEAARRAAYFCGLLGIKVVFYEDELFPELLKNISDPPFLLFCRGNENILRQEHSVSVVGTRRLTSGGKLAAREFARAAALDGCRVVSGLAYGADAAAHLGAVDAFYEAAFRVEQASRAPCCGTLAVLPCGIDAVQPSGNKPLAEKILRTGGCLVSEYEPGMEMANWHFVARNRIVAGLSPAVVVIEAPVGSGALITADFALEEGRDVFFHQAALSEPAQKVSGAVKNELDLRFAKKEVSKYKIENSVGKYLEAGAGVISDYDDYCRALSELPGERNVPLLQGELF